MQITDEITIQKYYQALLERKERFVGIFFVGVKTTSIFCIATCSARKPKFENVVFYTSIKDALANGYRPCKVCKPTENATKAPEQIEKAIRLVQENPKDKITDFQLRQLSISPEVTRRWFKKNYGITFQTYQRMYRINNAFLELKKGKKATHTAYDVGYESLSGFGYMFKKLVGTSPANSSTNNIILINRLTTPIGPMLIAATAKGICLLEFVDRASLETRLKDFQNLLKARIISGENDHIKQAKKELSAYFNGKCKQFTVPIDSPGTLFQQSVWNALRNLDYGHTATYEQQAQKINKPNAIRAVASANGYNKIAIIIPCHRVLGKNGKMTGYSGGIERKKWLLDHEQRHIH